MLEKIQKYETELWTVLCVLFFNIIAHGYRFVNLMFNGDSLLIYQTDQNWKYSIGRIFQPFYWKLRGDLVAPMLIATLAVFYFTAALVLIVRMFKLQNKLHIALLCALLAVNITTTSTFATDFHEGDTYMLALLCATVGVALFRKAHPVLGGVFICLCLGFYQAYLQLAIGLLILLFMQDLLKGKDPCKSIFIGVKIYRHASRRKYRLYPDHACAAPCQGHCACRSLQRLDQCRRLLQYQHPASCGGYLLICY